MAAEEDARFAGVCLDGHENICPAVTGSPVMRYRYFALLRAVSCFASSAGFYRPIFYCLLYVRENRDDVCFDWYMSF